MYKSYIKLNPPCIHGGITTVCIYVCGYTQCACFLCAALVKKKKATQSATEKNLAIRHSLVGKKRKFILDGKSCKTSSVSPPLHFHSHVYMHLSFIAKRYCYVRICLRTDTYSSSEGSDGNK